MKNFAGKIAFITGGASGAGLGQAKLFSKEGMRVAIGDIRQDALDKAVEEIRAYSGAKAEDVLAIRVDLMDREQYIAAADKIEEVFGGPPHLFIQTAGVNSFGPAEASTFDDYDWVVGVNFNAVVNGLVIFVPRMIRAYSGKTDCHVAATSSMGAFSGFATDAPYAAAKAAVNSLFYSYYEALKPYGIGATVLCPANINSNIGEAEKYRPEHLRNTGYNVTEETIAFLKSIHATGMDPIELAEWLKNGIVNEQVLVVPYENSEEMLRREFQKIIDFSSPEGMKRIAEAEEAQRKAMEEMMKNMPKPADGAPVMKDVGFAKARKDLDWVDPSKKMN
ncbi:MAG: SDR family NAD(P)-dependent oxidoreductase [Clostridiales bacterium]|jgi:NAD(P)-dependent dehydrogenase (short-subunit alcohol dehydrogenase family)|nr:SDR family NAD(P)-dependent oxidoreductase [Clostridiales bacterium]